MPQPFGALIGRLMGRYGVNEPRAVRPLPLPPNIVPQSPEAERIFGAGYRNLPGGSQRLLADHPEMGAVYSKTPEGEGWATSESVGVMFPSPTGELRWPAFTITPSRIATHELGHSAAEMLHQQQPIAWWGAASDLQRQAANDPAFQAALLRGHPRTRLLLEQPSGATSTADVVRDINAQRASENQYGGLTEYLASMIEHPSEPRRMPMPASQSTSLLTVLQQLLGSGR